MLALVLDEPHTAKVAETDEALAIISDLPITYDPAPDNARAIEIAVDLQRHSAYDTAYLALAERVDGEVWTLDGPLARNVSGRYRVSLID
jgi:predicted nucleic acid-binding protein